jgi:hypothetical protein
VFIGSSSSIRRARPGHLDATIAMSRPEIVASPDVSLIWTQDFEMGDRLVQG